MSDVERPTDAVPDDQTTPVRIGDESAYPGDPATQQASGPDDPADVQRGVESVDEADTGSGRRDVERDETLDQAQIQAP